MATVKSFFTVIRSAIRTSHRSAASRATSTSDTLNLKFWAKQANKGTVGTVKRCQCLKTNKFFAVKIIKSRDDELVFNVKKEYEKLRELQHGNIVSVHELIIDKLLGAIYLVMELFEGKEMFELLSDFGYYNG